MSKSLLLHLWCNMTMSHPHPSMLEPIFEAMRENEGFLRSSARDVEDEAVKLINESIDYLSYMPELPDKRKYYVEHAMAFLLHNVLMPFSYANYMNLLAGNLPGCFMGLRLMLESLTKCYLADTKYPKLAFFRERVEELDKELRQNRQSISRSMEVLGAELDVGDDFSVLWKELSDTWFHTRGFANKVVENIVNSSDAPSWALVLPMPYSLSDLDTIYEFGKTTVIFRSLLAVTMKKYKWDDNLG